MLLLDFVIRVSVSLVLLTYNPFPQMQQANTLSLSFLHIPSLCVFSDASQYPEEVCTPCSAHTAPEQPIAIGYHRLGSTLVWYGCECVARDAAIDRAISRTKVEGGCRGE